MAAFGRRTSSSNSVLNHSFSYGDKNLYPCSICGKVFNQSGNRKTHMLTHTDVRMFSCDVCGKKFKLKDHLKRHSVVHTGERPFVCDFCGQSFTQPSPLSIHRRRCPKMPNKQNQMSRGSQQVFHADWFG